MPSKKSATKRVAPAPDADLRICFDRVIPDAYQPARTSVERTLTGTMRSAGLISAFEEPRKSRAAMITFKKWPHNSLNCRFLDGDATQRKKVEAKAHIWEQFANVKFKFIDSGDAEIRISFTADPGSWSAVGTDALVEKFFPKFQPTMNFGWLKANTEDKEYERVVVHEFGHALGLIHEHQNPKAKLKWNKNEVYRVFSGAPNFWSKEEIDHNILSKYSPDGIDATKFDEDSIMLYMFPGSLFTNGIGTKNNTKLSKRDKEFIATEYPF